MRQILPHLIEDIASIDNKTIANKTIAGSTNSRPPEKITFHSPTLFQAVFPFSEAPPRIEAVAETEGNTIGFATTPF